MLWAVAFHLFYRPTPVLAHAWRSQILRLFGARIDRGAYPYPNVRIWAPWNLVMRKGSCLADEVDCYNVSPIVIEEGATVSQKAYLCAASHDYNSPAFPLTGGPIIVGRDAWVAADAFIGPGLSIGPRAVVLARAVVVRDVESGTVVGGNPGRVVGQRVTTQEENEEQT
jgi:putative colanic acid biosynthesis acetyltransferase WcaF